MLPKVFIDGHTGTTGLRIHQWMAGREDIELLTLPEELRRNPEERRGQVLEADVAVLCLPDDAAEEVAGWVAGTDTRLIDASTAHRVSEGWTYGLPELQPDQRDAIQDATLVSNPGCYPTGFTLLVRPLVDAGLLPGSAPISINALSGYSGGGNSLISKWEDPENGLDRLPYEAPYSLYQRHKHIPEMMKYAQVTAEPQFVPAVGPFRCGMRVQVPIHATMLSQGPQASRFGRPCMTATRGSSSFTWHTCPNPAPIMSAVTTPKPATTATGFNCTSSPIPLATFCWSPCWTTWARAPAGRRSRT